MSFGRHHLVAATVFVIVAAACGGGSGASSTEDTATTAAPTTTAPTTTAAPTTTQGTVATTTTAAPSTTVDAGTTDLVALGEDVFQRTAGGIGCQACHGADALGSVGPNILGKSAETIRTQLEFNENMTFIILSDEEIEAVAAYLAVLQAESEAAMGG